jgi:Lon protease-like protein
LKAQAKDLLDAHRRGEPQAFERIRAAVPAFARMSDEQLARAAFALHDAQSAIAREYGFASWAELRDQVAAQNASPPRAFTAEETAQLAAGLGLPLEAATAIVAARAKVEAARGEPTPAVVPVLPLRNAVAFPGGMIPIDVSRPTTRQAIEAAHATERKLIAIFAQRASETDRPAREDLHTPGCLCAVLYIHRNEAGDPARVVIQGIRWVALDAIEYTEPYYAARVSDAGVEHGDDQEIAALDRRLRDTARRFAHTIPAIRDEALAAIDGIQDVGQLADMAMATLGVPVSESAAYAQETQLARRLERVIAMLDAALAKAIPPPA